MTDDTIRAEDAPRRSGFYISLAGHGVLAALLVLLPKYGLFTGVNIIAAGPGEGGSGGGPNAAVQIGVASGSELFSVAPWAKTAAIGDDTKSKLNNLELAKKPPDAVQEDAVRLEELRDAKRLRENSVSTDRPVSESPIRPYSPRPEAGSRPGTSAVVGPSPGSPFPAVTSAPGIGMGAGGGEGVPGGSEYGRRIQQALSGYYRYSPPADSPVHYVIVRVRIDRAGRVLSIMNGRLDALALVQSSSNIVIDSRVAAALLELNRNPIPFPAGFLPGMREATAEIYFRY